MRRNARAEPARIRRDRGDTELKDQSYSYDRNGNRTVDERGEHGFNARDQLVHWKRGERQKRPGTEVSYELNASAMSGQSLSDNVGRWVEHAVASAASGEVRDENLRALLGSQYDPTLAWSQARASYTEVLERVRYTKTPLVLKLIVPLIPRMDLEVDPPDIDDIESEVDRQDTPPILVIHPPMFRRDWQPGEEYRRSFAADTFVGDDGVALAEGLYIAGRDQWELEDESEYHRYLMFERVQP